MEFRLRSKILANQKIPVKIPHTQNYDFLTSNFPNTRNDTSKNIEAQNQP